MPVAIRTASSTATSDAELEVPILTTIRERVIPRSCISMAFELFQPAILVDQHFERVIRSTFFVVIAATNINGLFRLINSGEMTTAGRVPLFSEPCTGSSFTRTTSPRHNTPS